MWGCPTSRACRTGIAARSSAERVAHAPAGVIPLRALAAFTLVFPAGAGGPYDIVLLPRPAVPAARGEARLVFADSPFGVAVTADGRHVYDVRITARGLPDPASLGGVHAYVAWARSARFALLPQLAAFLCEPGRYPAVRKLLAGHLPAQSVLAGPGRV